MTKGSHFNPCYDYGTSSEKPEFAVVSEGRWKSAVMDSLKSRSRSSGLPNFQGNDSRAPLHTIQKSQRPKSSALRPLSRTADLLKTRLPTPYKKRTLPPNPPEPRFKRVISDRVIPLSDTRRRSSLSSPSPRDPGIQTPPAESDPRPAKSLGESYPAQRQLKSFPPVPKHSTSRSRKISSRSPSLSLSRHHDFSSCGLDVRDFDHQGQRPFFETAEVVKHELVKEVQDLREKLHAQEHDKRIQDSRMHHLLLEQWKSIEELLKKKCAIMNKLRVVKSQSLSQHDEERLIKLLEKQEQYEGEIKEAENALRKINDKVNSAREEQNDRLKKEMYSLKDMENTLVHQRKWNLLKKAIKQATNKYHKVSGAANDLGCEILKMFRLRTEFFEKYDRIKQVMKSELKKVLDRSKSSSSVSKTRPDYLSKADFPESEPIPNSEKLAEDIVGLKRFVFSCNFLCDVQKDNTRMKTLIPKDPIIAYPIPLHITDKHDRMRLCQIALKKLVDVTNVKDVKNMCSAYRELEKKNLEALKGVQDYNIRNHEIYNEDEDQALQVASWRHKHSLETLSLFQKKIKLQSKLEAASTECEQLELICDEKTETILTVMQRIDKILQITGCYSLAKHNVFGTHRPLTYENIVRYLAILKDRVREILQLYNHHVKNASSSQTSKESQNVYTDDGTGISSSSPQLETQNLFPKKEPLLAGTRQSADPTKTPLAKRRKTLAEMQAEIDAVRKRDSDKYGIHPQTYRGHRDL